LLGEYALYQLLIGALFLGAFFMATDYATSPMSPLGKIVFGIGCGVFTVLIRLYGGYPEGVAFAILLMNLTVPLIDRYIRPRVFGTRRKKKNEN
jgi:electron transport complex protein RnfD